MKQRGVKWEIRLKKRLCNKAEKQTNEFFFNVTFSQFWFIFSTLFSLLRCDERSLYRRDFFRCQRTEMQMSHRLMVIDREESRQTGLRVITWLEWDKWMRQNASELRASESLRQSNVKRVCRSGGKKKREQTTKQTKKYLERHKSKEKYMEEERMGGETQWNYCFYSPLSLFVQFCTIVLYCYFLFCWCFLSNLIYTGDAGLCPVFYCILHFAWASWTELVETDLRYEAGFISH